MQSKMLASTVIWRIFLQQIHLWFLFWQGTLIIVYIKIKPWSKFRFYLFCLLWHHLLLLSFAGKFWKIQTDWTFFSVAATKLLINVFLHNHCFYTYPEMLYHSNMTHFCLMEICLNEQIKIYLKKCLLSISFSLL